MPMLYHYTNDTGYRGINRSRKIRATEAGSYHSHYGRGVYLTTIGPVNGTSEILRKMYNNARSSERNPHTGTRANYYFEFNSDNLPGVRMVHGGRDVWLYPDHIDFDKVTLVNSGQTPRTTGYLSIDDLDFEDLLI